MIITLFSTYGKKKIKEEHSEQKKEVIGLVFDMVMNIWDLVISGGTIYLVKSVL